MAKEYDGSIESARPCALRDELSKESGRKTQQWVDNSTTRPQQSAFFIVVDQDSRLR